LSRCCGLVEKKDASPFRHGVRNAMSPQVRDDKSPNLGKESNYWTRPFLNFHGQLLHFSDLLAASPIILVPMKTVVLCIITMRKYWWFRLSPQARHKHVLGIRFFIGPFGEWSDWPSKWQSLCCNHLIDHSHR